MGEPIDKDATKQVGGFPISDFDWIIDKNLLRDEGIYYGLSDADHVPNEKIEAIRQFFQERIRTLETDTIAKHSFSQQKEKEIADQHTDIAQKQIQIQSIKEDLVYENHDFWRVLVGLTLYISIFLFNFWLIFSWLETAQVKTPFITALGVYLFGSLNLFGRFSILYHSDESTLNGEQDQREKWKVYLEEFFIPFIASVYICYLGAGSHDLAGIVIFFLLIYTLFLFTGKGILNQLVSAKTESIKFLGNMKRKSDGNKSILKLQAAISQQNIANEENQKQLLIVQAEILESEKAIAMITEQKETNVFLFLSEYELAKAARQSLNRKQIGQIISSRR